MASPQQLSKMGTAAMRKEYSRLRSIARKRLERLGASEFRETAAYQLNVHHYPTLKNITNTGELADRLSDLQRFLAAEGSTVTGQKRIRQKRIEGLHRHGFDFVNKDNLRQFGEFMQMLRALYPGRPSDTVNLESQYGAYKVLRTADYTPAQLKRLFNRYIQKIQPEHYYLKGVRPIPNEYRFDLKQ